MRRLALTAAALIFAVPFPLTANVPVDIFLQTEYKFDTIDYSEDNTYYYREKAKIFFSEESMFNFSCIILTREEDKHTWNLLLNDISPHFSFILGNYFAQFGAGLLLGKQRMFEPDIFENRPAELASTFSPCNSGNPVYSFYGIALSSYINIKNTGFTLNLFYSINERFTDRENYEFGISSSASSLENSISQDYDEEMIGIHTAGIMASAFFLKHILFQSYIMSNNIRNFYDHEILWEYDETYNVFSGIKNILGYGFFSQYKDDFLNLLFELGITRKKMALDNESAAETGYGMLCGIEFTPPFLALSLKAKNVKPSFYSPFSSSIGENYPETAVFFDAGIKPFANLKFLAGISSQRKNKPSNTDDGIVLAEREKIGIEYHYKALKKATITVRRLERNSNENEKLQSKASIDAALSKNITIKTSGIYQKNYDNRWSKLFSCGFDMEFFKYLNIDAYYILAYISDRNPVYAVYAPVYGSATPGFFIRRDSNVALIKMTYKYKEIYLSCRYMNQHKKTITVFNRFEFIASALF